MLIKQVKTREAIWNQKIVTYYKTCVFANDKPVSLQDSLWYRIVYDTRSNILSSLYIRMREGIMPREQPHFSLLSYTHIYTLPVCAYHTYSHLYTYTYIYCSTHTHTHTFFSHSSEFDHFGVSVIILDLVRFFVYLPLRLHIGVGSNDSIRMSITCLDSFVWELNYFL